MERLDASNQNADPRTQLTIGRSVEIKLTKRKCSELRTSELRGLLFFSDKEQNFISEGSARTSRTWGVFGRFEHRGLFFYKEHNFDNRDIEFEGTVCSATCTGH